MRVERIHHIVNLANNMSQQQSSIPFYKANPVRQSSKKERSLVAHQSSKTANKAANTLYDAKAQIIETNTAGANFNRTV